MENADKAVLRLGLGMGLSVAIAWGVGLEAAFMAPVMTIGVAGQTGTADPAREGRGAGLCHRRAIAGRCSDGPDPGVLPGDRRPADGRIVLRGDLHQRAQGKPVDALHACRPRVHSRGRLRQSGGGYSAGPDGRGRAPHRRAGQCHLARFVSGCSRAGESRSGTRGRQSGSGRLDRPAG